jgi:glutamate-ammonia-ligase adenylyltransferase
VIRTCRLLDPIGAEYDDVSIELSSGEAAERLLARLRETEQGSPTLERFRAANPEALRRLSSVVALSSALGEHLVANPADLAAFEEPTAFKRAFTLDQLTAQFTSAVTNHGRAGLVRAYRRVLLAIASRDLAHNWPVEAIAAELSDAANAVLAAALAFVTSQVTTRLNMANPQTTAPGETKLAVIAMGKAGGRELNYVSDVDVIFVYEGDEAQASELASSLVNFISTQSEGGPIWEVDTALRPEGKAGLLVRNLAQLANYYDKHAETWEFQALLKARPAAGDAQLGQKFLDLVTPLVWQASARNQFVADTQAMRRRVEENISQKDADRQLKLGRGGLRDVEFAVQLLQLVHGRDDPTLRSPTTLTALQALATWGYVGRDDAANLARAYKFLRRLEHRMQLRRLARAQVLTEDPAELTRLGRAMGFKVEPAAELNEAWRKESLQVRRIHEKLFYRPLLSAVAKIPGDQARLNPGAATKRLTALGYTDPASALRHLTALASGVTRRAAIQKTLLPVMLEWFAETPSPDAGLLAFRRLSDALGSTPWYLRLLRDESAAAERLARVLAASPYVSKMLLLAPDSVAVLADDQALTPRSLEALRAEVGALVERNIGTGSKLSESLQAFRRRELIRIGAEDVLGLLEATEVATAVSDVAEVMIQGALHAALARVASEEGYESATGLPIRFAVIGMGRLGGAEMGYASDADVMYVYETAGDQGDVDETGASDETSVGKIALAVAEALREIFARAGTENSLTLDEGLRPEGKNGPLVRSLAAYSAYYARWSAPWESQALLRARFIAGDEHLGEKFAELIDPLRYPANGLAEADLREIRRIKARVEAERLPRGADPALNAKLGPGAISDVEWLVQLLQLAHANRELALRTTKTLTALEQAAKHGLISTDDAQTLSEAWQLATRIRNTNTLALERPTDEVPTDLTDLAATSFVLGYPLGQHTQLLEDYRRITRRARTAFNQKFYRVR